MLDVGVDLEEEENKAGFVGVCMEHDEEFGLLELKQTELIDQVIETLDLHVGTTTGKWTPRESVQLVKNMDGKSPSRDFSYSSVIGMLLYLAGHISPDITYMVHCAVPGIWIQSNK